MKRTILIISGLIALALPAFAAEEPAKQETKVEAKTDYKDAFLQLALEKSKLYSGKMEDAVSQGIDMAKKEVPELAKEWLTWRFYYHLWGVVMPLGVILIMVCWLVYWYFANKKERWNDDTKEGIFITSCFICFIPFLICVITLCADDNIIKLIQIKTAPRIYMIEEVSKLIRH